MREMRLPMWVRLPSSGHLYSAIALASSHQFRRSPFPHLSGSLRDGGLDADICAAAAEIAAHAHLDLFRRRRGMFFEQRRAGHDEAGSAKAALLRVVVPEGLLDRMEIAVLFESFDGPNLLALRLDGQRRAGINRLAVHDHRAGAACGAVADAFGPGDVQIVPQRVEQSDARFDAQLLRGAVYVECDIDIARAEYRDFGPGGFHFVFAASDERNGESQTCAFEEVSARHPALVGFIAPFI